MNITSTTVHWVTRFNGHTLVRRTDLRNQRRSNTTLKTNFNTMRALADNDSTRTAKEYIFLTFVKILEETKDKNIRFLPFFFVVLAGLLFSILQRTQSVALYWLQRSRDLSVNSKTKEAASVYLCFESFTSGRRPPNTQLAAIKGNKTLKNNSVFKSLDTAQEKIAGTFFTVPNWKLYYKTS